MRTPRVGDASGGSERVGDFGRPYGSSFVPTAMPTVSVSERDANPRLTFTATDPATCAVMDVWGTPPPPDDPDVAEETHDDDSGMGAESQPAATVAQSHLDLDVLAAYHSALKRQRPPIPSALPLPPTAGRLHHLVMSDGIVQRIHGKNRGHGHTTLVPFALAVPAYRHMDV